jgi:hypothetical protein
VTPDARTPGAQPPASPTDRFHTFWPSPFYLARPVSPGQAGA